MNIDRPNVYEMTLNNAQNSNQFRGQGKLLLLVCRLDGAVRFLYSYVSLEAICKISLEN